MAEPTVCRTALVTGASSGIGYAFARVLAREGYALVLTARREGRLQTLAGELRASRGVQVTVLPGDLADPRFPEDLVGSLRARSVRVDVLVNNAGYGVPGAFASTAWPQQRDFLQVMVTAVCELTHLLLPGMLERRWGRIINVASLAGLMPAVAGHTLYAASKAFLVRFSEALAAESLPHGVHVTAVCPGFTRSEFHDVTGTRAMVETMPSWVWLSPEQVAEEGYAAVMRGQPVVVNGRLNQGMALAARYLPQRLVSALMQRNAGKFRKL